MTWIDATAHAPVFLRRKPAPGLGIAALASLLQARRIRAAACPGCRTFAPTAKRVIYLFQSGAPSQMDLFDYKPRLHGSRQDRAAGFHPQGPAPDRHDLRRRPAFPVAPSIFQFQQHGESGRLGQRADAAPGEGGRRSLLRQVDVHRGDQSRSGGHLLPDRLSACRPAVASAPGSPTAWAARTRICRRSS